MLVLNNRVIICWGYCGDTLYSNKIIMLPITYNVIYSALCSTKNTSNSVCNRVKIVNTGSLNFSRSGGTDVSGWYACIGI